jgi:hypothetical protein
VPAEKHPLTPEREAHLLLRETRSGGEKTLIFIDDEKPQGETVIELNFGAQLGAISIVKSGYRIIILAPIVGATRRKQLQDNREQL